MFILRGEKVVAKRINYIGSLLSIGGFAIFAGMLSV